MRCLDPLLAQVVVQVGQGFVPITLYCLQLTGEAPWVLQLHSQPFAPLPCRG